MALAATLPERLVHPPRLTREQRLDRIGRPARSEMLPPLARFIKYLSSSGLVKFGPPLAPGEAGLAVVDRIQQHAFLALYFGLDMGFDFDMHIGGGPAAYEMADAIYRLSDEDSAVYDAAEPAMPRSFRGGEFLDMASGRSPVWLGAATTMLDINIDDRNLDWVRRGAMELTLCGPAVADDALGEIKRRGMLRTE